MLEQQWVIEEGFPKPKKLGWLKYCQVSEGNNRGGTTMLLSAMDEVYSALINGKSQQIIYY